jgi:signal transduction histidine kinase
MPVEVRRERLVHEIRALTAEVERGRLAHAAYSELLRRVVDAQEQERRRIARELHDQMGQLLTALSIGLRTLELSASAAEPARARLEELCRLTDEIGRHLHDMALELHPSALDDLGLHPALTQLVQNWSRQTGIPVEFDASTIENDRFPAPIELTLYRVVQESLTNVAKHAQATRVSVSLEREGQFATARIEDNGRGFDMQALTQSKQVQQHLGIPGMRERLKALCGEFRIDSRRGRGTAVCARISLPDFLQSQAAFPD